jgi:hypothetical protein
MPSTTTSTFFHGRRVRGWPLATCARSTPSSESTSLCAKTATFAPDPRAPLTIEAWLSASETMRQPGPASAGSTAEFVAKPIPKQSAAGFPRNAASSPSRSTWSWVVPASARGEQDDQPSLRSVSTARGVQ